MAASLSSAEFKKAVNEFKDTADKYANGDRGDHAVDVIVGAITGMVFDNENGFKSAKTFTNKATGEGGSKIILLLTNYELLIIQLSLKIKINK